MSLRDDALLLNVRGGARLCVPRTLDQITPYVLLEQEDWFENEIRFVRLWLKPGMRVIDVGANYGVYAVAAALAVGRSGAVWAFEPTPDCVPFLRRSLEMNCCASHATVIPAAISDRSGKVSFALRTQPEMNAIVAEAAGAAGRVELAASTLDEMMQECGWSDIDFLKLDVEGHEIHAVRGGGAFFAANSPLVMMEVKAGRRVDFGALELLAGMGYATYRLLPGPNVLVPLERAEAVDAYQLNLFACKPDRARRLAAGGFLADPAEAKIGEKASQAWSDYILSAPYAGDLAARWPSGAGFFSGADSKAYFEGLAAFAQARDGGQDAAQRCAWLGRAMRCLGQAAEATDQVGRHISYARVAWEVGERKAAVDALLVARERLEDASAEAWSEPFLAPNPRYESLAAGAGPGEWLRCAVIEQLEKLRWYTSMNAGTTSLEILQPIMELPWRSAEMDRRWQLVRMAAGEQAAPEPRPQLCVRSDENLNPEYWRGAQRA
jgi:FkbM family methyltransferase